MWPSCTSKTRRRYVPAFDDADQALWEHAGDAERWHWADGAGNVFWMFDARGVWSDAPGDCAGQAAAWCAQGPRMAVSGVQRAKLRAADGWLILCDSLGGADVRMVLWNPDGTRPEACGNALRCVARKLFDETDRTSNGSASYVVETDAGLRSAGVDASGEAWAEMGPVEETPGSRAVRIGHEMWTGWRVSVGNPHFVLPLDGVEDWRVPEVGRALSVHPTFPEGTNVEFPFRHAGGLRVRVWERGVGETEACGTGACAAAWVHHFQHGEQDPLTVHMKGGSLRVAWRAGAARLQGPARVQGIGPKAPAAP